MAGCPRGGKRTFRRGLYLVGNIGAGHLGTMAAAAEGLLSRGFGCAWYSEDAASRTTSPRQPSA